MEDSNGLATTQPGHLNTPPSQHSPAISTQSSHLNADRPLNAAPPSQQSPPSQQCTYISKGNANLSRAPASPSVNNRSRGHWQWEMVSTSQYSLRRSPGSRWRPLTLNKPTQKENLDRCRKGRDEESLDLCTAGLVVGGWRSRIAKDQKAATQSNCHCSNGLAEVFFLESRECRGG